MASTLERNRIGGFTLLELLIVISIIALLAALTVFGTRKAIETARASSIKMQISQLELALDRYKDKVGEYPPDDFTNIDSIRRHIKRRWPRLNYSASDLSAAGIGDINGDGATDMADAFTTCAYDSSVSGATPDKASFVSPLVFWLGGPLDDNDNPAGFYLQPKDPLGFFDSTVGTAADPGQREEVYFKFPSDTIVVNNGIPAFVPGKSDEKPLVYFRADGSTDPWLKTTPEADRPKGAYAAYYPYTDAQLNDDSLAKFTRTKYYSFSDSYLGVAAPYAQTTVSVKIDDDAPPLYEYTWYEPERFQLIFPGMDGEFHTDDGAYALGAQVRNVDTQEGISESDYDNIVNFTEGVTLESEW